MSAHEPEPRPATPKSRLSAAGKSVVGLANGVTAVVAAIGAVLGLILVFGDGEQSIPQPSAAAAASPEQLASYQQSVGRICRTQNQDTRRATRSNRSLARRLGRARTTGAQRDVLLYDVNRIVGRASDLVARFGRLDAPASLKTLHARAGAAWRRNVERMRGYAQRLDGIGDRGDLVLAIGYLSKLRPAFARDSEALKTGLLKLGSANCRLDRPRFTKPAPLPGLRRTTPTSSTLARQRTVSYSNAVRPPGRPGVAPPRERPTPAANNPASSLFPPGKGPARSPGPDVTPPLGSATTDPPAGPSQPPAGSLESIQLRIGEALREVCRRAVSLLDEQLSSRCS